MGWVVPARSCQAQHINAQEIGDREQTDFDRVSGEASEDDEHDSSVREDRR
jgi:hypothetical protein